MKGSTIRKFLFWVLASECSIFLFFRKENVVFNLVLLFINVFVSLLLTLQKTPKEEMKKHIEEITGIKYPQTAEEIQKAINELGEEGVVQLGAKEEERTLLNKILKALGLKE